MAKSLPLPRAIIRNRDYLLLDGVWSFALDAEDQGLQQGWHLGHAYAATAPWPGSIEDQLTHAQGQVAHTRAWQDRIAAWYERTFEIPIPWLETPGLMVQLTFGACSYETRVWLNGHPLQTVEGEEVHFGGYTSFSYELPSAYLLPQNRLTVRVAHSFDEALPRGKQESRVYKRGGIWYQTITGGVRSVWIEPIERNRLRSRLAVNSRIVSRLAEFTFTIRIHDPGQYRLRLAVTAPGGTHLIAADEFRLALDAGERRQHIALSIPSARQWSPANPVRYALRAQLIGADDQVSQIEALFGLRRIATRGGEVYLNDRRIYLDGILYQPGASHYEAMRAHLHTIKQLGCNLARVHIAGVDPRLYDLADELGLLLWVEVPSPHTSSEISRENHWAELKRMLVMVGSHPSVAIFSLYNEGWGAEDIAIHPATRAYVARVYEYMKINFPHLMIVDNDGWQHVSVEGRLRTDLLTAHVYTADLNTWQHRLDGLVTGDWSGVVPRPLVVGDPFFFRGQTPLVVSEWGGFGFSDYGGPSDSVARVDLIRAFKRELRRRPIAGDVYTQATNIEDEVNGLISADGSLLVPPGLLASSPADPSL